MKQASKIITNVALVDVGERLKVDLSVLVNKLNSSQKTFRFSYVGKIYSEVVGDPDLGEYWYRLETLINILKRHFSLNESFDFVIGITDFRMTDEESFSNKDLPIKDYFSHSDCDRLSLVSTNDHVYVYNSKLRDAYQYAAYQIIAELFINISKRDLMHKRPDNCLFDNCEDRTTFKKSIELSYICRGCEKELARFDKRMIKDFLKILTYCKGNDWKLALVSAVKSPATNLIAGALLGWILSIITPPQNLTTNNVVMIISPIIIVPSLIYLYKRYFSK